MSAVQSITTAAALEACLSSDKIVPAMQERQTSAVVVQDAE